MKIIIYSRPEIDHDTAELETFVNALISAGIEYYFNSDFANIILAKTGIETAPNRRYSCREQLPTGADMAISYGGDGTFLDTVRLVDTAETPILGINSGRLGFLANVSKSDIVEVFSQITAGRYSVEKRILIEAAGDFPAPLQYPYAFNEFSIQKSGVTMVSVDVWIDDEFITTYLGDGVILSTPAGSTAYSLSVGGPIVAPDNACFVLAPIASHNLTMRPVIISDSSAVKFRVTSRSGTSFVTMDNRDFEVATNSSFTIKRAEKCVNLVKLHNISFYRTLRDKMMWGVDNRN